MGLPLNLVCLSTSHEVLNTRLTVEIGTLNYQVCPAVIDNEQYLFIDTAGFGAADMNDEENHLNIVSSLETLRDFVEFAGLLFVYGSANNTREMREDAKTMQWAQCFFGPDFYQKITVVTTMWDNHSESAMRRILKKGGKLDEVTETLKDILDPPDHYHGGLLYHHGLPNGKATTDFNVPVQDVDMVSERGDEMKRLLHDRYRVCNSKLAKLQIECELDEGRDPMETEAAKVLNATTENTKIIIRDGRAIVTKVVHLQPTKTVPTPASNPCFLQNQAPKPEALNPFLSPPPLRASRRINPRKKQREKPRNPKNERKKLND